ncbi:MAG: leucine-rich repeat domain-containing protein, partial [Promethearchaeota archaeon]
MKNSEEFIIYKEVKWVVDDTGFLNLEGYHIIDTSELKGLEDLTTLKELWLDNNYVRAVRSLENCQNLRRLSLLGNRITEITKIAGLEDLTNLRELNLAYNNISILEGLDTLENLEVLNLDGNYIS